jgi:hypothetical protein
MIENHFQVFGFNYSGSWGTSGLDLWQHHDHGRMEVEVTKGKEFFPAWNVARWWLSQDGFQRDRLRFMTNFEAGLTILERHGIRVMPVLFNRWRDPNCDFGGTPLDFLIPGWGPLDEVGFTRPGRDETNPSSIRSLFADYLAQVVGEHANDPRILAWDLCNEPFGGPSVIEESFLRDFELNWLGWCYDVCKDVEASQPLTVGNLPLMASIELTERWSDVISFHPYYIPALAGEDSVPLGTKPRFEAFLDEVCALAAERGKGLIASETCWGANDDQERVELLRYTVGELVKRGLASSLTLCTTASSLICTLQRMDRHQTVGSSSLM